MNNIFYVKKKEENDTMKNSGFDIFTATMT